MQNSARAFTHLAFFHQNNILDQILPHYQNRALAAICSSFLSSILQLHFTFFPSLLLICWFDQWFKHTYAQRIHKYFGKTLHCSPKKFLCSFSSLLQNNTDVRLGAIPSMPMIFSKQLFPCWLSKRLKKRHLRSEKSWEKKKLLWPSENRATRKMMCNNTQMGGCVGGTRSHKYGKGTVPSNTQGNNYP